jgi:hypothetical protein
MKIILNTDNLSEKGFKALLERWSRHLTDCMQEDLIDGGFDDTTLDFAQKYFGPVCNWQLKVVFEELFTVVKE